jgi:hypothetical protein
MGLPHMSCESVLKRSDGWHVRHVAVAVPIAVVTSSSRSDAAGLGVQLAYSGFFSVFSLLLAFVWILGFAFRSDLSFQKQILDSPLRLMPVIGPHISGHIGSLTGSAVALVVGLASAVWTGTSAERPWRRPARFEPAAVRGSKRWAGVDSGSWPTQQARAGWSSLSGAEHQPLRVREQHHQSRRGDERRVESCGRREKKYVGHWHG